MPHLKIIQLHDPITDTKVVITRPYLHPSHTHMTKFQLEAFLENQMLQDAHAAITKLQGTITNQERSTK